MNERRLLVNQNQSDFRPLLQLKCVFDVNAEIADRAFDLGILKKDLNGA